MMIENFFKTTIAYNNWKSKYQYKDETPLGTFQRIAKSLASNEKNPDEWYHRFLNTMIRFDEDGNPMGIKCSPGGRITTNIGTDYRNATLMNCFINGPVRNATITYIRKNENFENKVKIKSPDTPDNLVNIFLTIMEQAKTLASEGGYGLNFDFIRPRGSVIKGTGIRHPGVVSYMEVWDTVAGCIVKGDNDGYLDTLKDYTTEEERLAFFDIIDKETRKGAMMGCLSIDHPDIEEFVRAKQESGKLTKFNMSVAVTDAFMIAVEKDTMWELKWEGQVVKRVKARHLYDLIMKSTYNRAEPGILFVDNMNKNNPISYLGECNATNPCVVKGTLVATKGGLKRVEDVKIEDEIQTTLGYGNVKNIEVHKNHPIYRVHFTDGFSQDVTEGHIFHSQNKTLDNRKRWNTETRLKDLNVGDMIRKQPYLNMYSDNSCQHYPSLMNIGGIDFDARDVGLLIGLYFGDGCFSNYKHFNISVNSTEDNTFIINLYNRFGFNYRIDESEGECNRYYATNTNNKIKMIFDYLGINPNEKFNFDVVKILNFNSVFLSGLLDGLISSDGNVNTTSRYPQIRFKNISNEVHFLVKHIMLKAGCDYKKYLCGKIGDSTKIYERDVIRKHDIYEGVIDNDSILNFYNYVGYLSHSEKNEKLKRIIKTTSLNGNKWKTQIKEIEFIGYGDVYDLYEPEADDWNTEGYVSRGCGEIPGNPVMSTVCLLGSINLPMYVNIIDGVPCFDWELYKEDVSLYSRMLDNVCDLTELPLPSYAWAVKNLRQFGMGLNGLGSMLIMLGIKYNSPEGVEFTKRLKELKENITMQTSSLLAKEKGAFPLYDYDKFSQTEYFKSDRLNAQTKEMIKNNGLRNAKTTTNPPLGNSSVICDNVSNGIEPVFDLESTRKVICQFPEGMNSENVKSLLKEKKKKDFVFWVGDYNGKKYYYEPHNRGLCEIYTLRDYGYQWILDHFPKNKKADFLITTSDLDIQDHLNIQEVVQFYCNQSVSKTINLPNKYSFDKFKELYIEAWKRGLIGVTTYRTGSMESVMEKLEHAEEKNEIIKKGVKLPETFVNGPTKTIKREGMKFYIHFSYLPEDSELKYPIAMWINTNNKTDVRASTKACKKLSTLAVDCGIELKIIEDTWDKCLGDNASNRLARMVSLCLRHNIPRQDILVALRDINGDNVSTLLTAVRKFIGETIEDGTHIVGLQCPECKSDSLSLESGCFVCKDCGHSGCGA